MLIKNDVSDFFDAQEWRMILMKLYRRSPEKMEFGKRGF